MWKAVMATRQLNMSVPTMPSTTQNAPQPAIPSTQMSTDPKSMEFMTMLARMMSLSTANQENIEKGFPRAQ